MKQVQVPLTDFRFAVERGARPRLEAGIKQGRAERVPSFRVVIFKLVHEVVILGRALDRGFARPRWGHGDWRAELIRAIGEAGARGGEGSAFATRWAPGETRALVKARWRRCAAMRL